jgi:small subunit ribosomal protein S6
MLILFDPRPTDEEVAALLARLGETAKGLGAEITKVENWGRRRLAHELRKQREGTYAVLEFSAEPAMVREFERQLRLNEQVLRFVTTRVPERKRVRSAPRPEAAPVAEEVV